MVKTPEDILQSIYDSALQAIRTSTQVNIQQDAIVACLTGGAREHRELPTVSTTYGPGNSITFTAPKRHVRIYCEEDMYWVDSAVDGADATTKLTTANQRGFIKRGDKLELSLTESISRLDFLAVNTAGKVYVTGLA